MEIRALVINVYWRKFYCLSVDRLNRYFYTFVVSFKLYTQITILYYWLCSFLTIYFPNFFLSLFLSFFPLFRSFFVWKHSTIFVIVILRLWLGFPDLRSGQKPWWTWCLTSVANFDEIRRSQLAKSTLLTSSLVPLGSFQIF